MTKYVYDEEAGERLHMDVVHEVDDRPGSVSEWLAAMRRLNAVKDHLVRRLIELHRDCGSGQGECDSGIDDPAPRAERTDWGREKTSIIAAHYGIQYRTREDDHA